MKRRSSLLLPPLRLVLCATCCVAACGNGMSWGVDGSKPISSLGADEAALACEGFSDLLIDTFPIDEQNRVACTRRGLGESFDPTGCQTVYDECIASPPPDVFDGTDCTSAMASADCSATVAELEGCASALLQAWRARDDQLDCSLAGNSAELARLSEPLPTPDECMAIEEACPILAGDVLGGIRRALGGL